MTQMKSPRMYYVRYDSTCIITIDTCIDNTSIVNLDKL